MKKYLSLIVLGSVVLCASCVKEKNCRCSVLGTQEVRIVTLSKGDCHKLNQYIHYDELDIAHVDTIVCTDYPFEADTLVTYQTSHQ